MRAAALQLVNQGFRVIPLEPGGKKPIWKKWQDRAISDPLDAIELWPGDDYNVGIACGDGLVVLDVDPVRGGEAHLAALIDSIGQLPPTRTVRTQSGGWHFYFRTTDGSDLSNGAKTLQTLFGDGLDVRGKGGQVVAPGMVFKETGGRYVLENDLPIAPIPEGLLAVLRTAYERTSEAGATLGELDDPGAVDAARAWLERQPDTFEGSRDNTGYAVACRFYDFGCSAATCRELLDEWNEKKCFPSLSDDDIDRIVSSALTSRQDVIGRDNPVAGFDVIVPPPPEACPLASRIWSFDQTEADEEAMPPRPWIAHRRLIRGKLSSLVAPGSIGKSLLTLQWACAVAMGQGAWCGLDVRERVNVLVVNNEDDREEMGARLGAVIRHHRLNRAEIHHHVKILSGSDAPLIAVRRNGKNGGLVDTEYVQLIVNYCKANAIGVVMFDPLVDMHEANENDNSEMSRVMRTFRKIATAANVAVLLVHHTKKPPQAAGDGYAGSADAGRGASAVVNAVRIGMTLFNMGEKDAERYGVPPARRHLYVRLDDAKANLFLASPEAAWFERRTVHMPSGEEGGVLVPAALVDRSRAEAADILSEVAMLSRDEPKTVNELAEAMAESPFFADMKPGTIRNRIVAALQTAADVDVCGGRLDYEPRGKTGGIVRFSCSVST